MNSQEIIIKFKNKENGVLNKIKESNIPLVQINNKGNEFGVFIHPILGLLYVGQKDYLIIKKTFFPKATKEDFYQIGKFARQLTNMGAQYQIILSNDVQEKLLFSHVMQEKFYSN